MQFRYLTRRPARPLARWLASHLSSGHWTSTTLLCAQYIVCHHRLPRLRQPARFNDHLFRLKINGTLHDPLRQFVSDKEYVKHYVEGHLGADAVTETYAVLRSDRDIEEYAFDRVPCVIKPTHMSGEAIILYTRKAKIDRAILKGWLRSSYFRVSREANYRYLRPKIIVEEFFSSDPPMPPDDYKIFCWYGHPELIQVDSGRFDRHTRNLYDPLWNRLPMMLQFPPRDIGDGRPSNLDRMLEAARILARPFGFIRVDLYSDGRRIRVGELTSCPDGGMAEIRPDRADYRLGSMFSRS